MQVKETVGGSWQHQTTVQPCALHLFPDIMKSKKPRGSKKEKKKKTITNHLWYRVRKMRSFNERMGPKKVRNKYKTPIRSIKMHWTIKKWVVYLQSCGVADRLEIDIVSGYPFTNDAFAHDRYMVQFGERRHGEERAFHIRDLFTKDRPLGKVSINTHLFPGIWKPISESLPIEIQLSFIPLNVGKFVQIQELFYLRDIL